MTAVQLVADIGGTHLRCALVEGGELRRERTLACAEFASPAEALRTYLREMGGAKPSAGAFALATAIDGDHIAMTNSAWQFSLAHTQRELGLARLIALNDFTALAHALPYLSGEQKRQVGGGSAVPGAPLAVIGAGTGLGVSGLFPHGDAWIAIDGEGGHCSFSPANQREADILRIVWRDYPHVSNERLLSGIGFDNLYRAIAELDQRAAPSRTPAQITRDALEARDALCIDTLKTFCAMLGTATANLALTLGARGGVYIGGGIVPKLGEFFDHSEFRARFEAKGRFSAYLATIPTCVILAPNAALIGAAHALNSARNTT